MHCNNTDVWCREDDLKILVAEHGVAQDVRLVKSRNTSRIAHDIAFITFASTHDARVTRQAIRDKQPGPQRTGLEVTFAPDCGAQKASIASQAVAAAAAMNSYNSAHHVDTSGAKPDDSTCWKPREIPSQQSAEEAAVPGFVYDEASGYYYDASSGYFYDAQTQLYYHPTTLSWYRLNNETGEYDVIPADSTTQVSERSEMTGGEVVKHPNAGQSMPVHDSRPDGDTKVCVCTCGRIFTRNLISCRLLEGQLSPFFPDGAYASGQFCAWTVI